MASTAKTACDTACTPSQETTVPCPLDQKGRDSQAKKRRTCLASPIIDRITCAYETAQNNDHQHHDISSENKKLNVLRACPHIIQANFYRNPTRSFRPLLPPPRSSIHHRPGVHVLSPSPPPCPIHHRPGVHVLSSSSPSPTFPPLLASLVVALGAASAVSPSSASGRRGSAIRYFLKTNLRFCSPFASRCSRRSGLSSSR